MSLAVLQMSSLFNLNAIKWYYCLFIICIIIILHNRYCCYSKNNRTSRSLSSMCQIESRNNRYSRKRNISCNTLFKSHGTPHFLWIKLYTFIAIQGIILVYDITCQHSFDNITKWLQNIEAVSIYMFLSNHYFWFILAFLTKCTMYISW